MDILNSIGNKKERLPDEKNLNIYICGPTVYNQSHLGHARVYCSFDTIRRILMHFFNRNVTYVMNITDIDDKIINASNEEGVNFVEFSRKWEEDFLRDMKSLNVLEPDIITRVSENIDVIFDFAEKIMDNGYAYKSNGSLYFDVNKFTEKFVYPKFLNITDENTDAVNDKKDKRDFVLLKKSKENEPYWDFNGLKVRPGWHIECSAMYNNIFDVNEDNCVNMHFGGEDLKFPHHENEIAQNEAFFNKISKIKYFMHVGHLCIKGAKMSKSTKNFITIQDALKNYTYKQLRMLFLLHKYNFVMEYNENSVSYAVNIEKIIQNFFDNILMKINKQGKYIWKNSEMNLYNQFLQVKVDIRKSLMDDFDTPNAIKSILNFIKYTNIYLESTDLYNINILKSIYDYLLRIMEIFGISYKNTNNNDNSSKIIDILVNFRSSVKNEIFKLTDQVRNDLNSVGIKLVDKGNKSEWK